MPGGRGRTGLRRRRALIGEELRNAVERIVGLPSVQVLARGLMRFLTLRRQIDLRNILVILGADFEKKLPRHFAQEPHEIDRDTWAIGDLAEFSAEGGVVESTWRSRCFGTKEPAWLIVVRRRTTLPARLNACLRLNF